MEPTNYQLALSQADELALRAHHSARWLARYYVIFGVASLLIAPAFGLLHGLAWTIVLTGLWGALILGISLYAAKQRTMVRGGARIHGWVMAVWTLVWVTTVVLGNIYELAWPWWVAGGVAMLVTCFIGARAVLRRTRLQS